MNRQCGRGARPRRAFLEGKQQKQKPCEERARVWQRRGTSRCRNNGSSGKSRPKGSSFPIAACPDRSRMADQGDPRGSSCEVGPFRTLILTCRCNKLSACCSRLVPPPRRNAVCQMPQNRKELAAVTLNK